MIHSDLLAPTVSSSGEGKWKQNVNSQVLEAPDELAEAVFIAALFISGNSASSEGYGTERRPANPWTLIGGSAR